MSKKSDQADGYETSALCRAIRAELSRRGVAESTQMACLARGVVDLGMDMSFSSGEFREFLDFMYEVWVRDFTEAAK